MSSKIASISDKTKKGWLREWTESNIEEVKTIIKELKKHFNSAPRNSKPFEIYTDACER